MLVCVRLMSASVRAALVSRVVIRRRVLLADGPRVYLELLGMMLVPRTTPMLARFAQLAQPLSLGDDVRRPAVLRVVLLAVRRRIGVGDGIRMGLVVRLAWMRMLPSRRSSLDVWSWRRRTARSLRGRLMPTRL